MALMKIDYPAKEREIAGSLRPFLGRSPVETTILIMAHHLPIDGSL